MIGTHQDALDAIHAALKPHESLRGNDLVLLNLKVARDAAWALDEALYELRGARKDLAETYEEMERLHVELSDLENELVAVESDNELLRSSHDL